MNPNPSFHGMALAVDLGASSGRLLSGVFDGETIRIEELHRFDNQPVQLLDTLYWDFPRLVHELKRGLALAVGHSRESGLPLLSVGIDTWESISDCWIARAIDRPSGSLSGPAHRRHHGSRLRPHSQEGSIRTHRYSIPSLQHDFPTRGYERSRRSASRSSGFSAHDARPILYFLTERRPRNSPLPRLPSSTILEGAIGR